MLHLWHVDFSQQVLFLYPSLSKEDVFFVTDRIGSPNIWSWALLKIRSYYNFWWEELRKFQIKWAVSDQQSLCFISIKFGFTYN